jgi:hypothetical protein
MSRTSLGSVFRKRYRDRQGVSRLTAIAGLLLSCFVACHDPRAPSVPRDGTAPDPHSGLPPIALAVCATSPALVELLLDARAKPDPRFGSGEGMTPLAMASRVQWRQTVDSREPRASPTGCGCR